MLRRNFVSHFDLAALVCLLFLLTQGMQLRASGQQPGEDPRVRAFRLFDEHKLIEALPLLEKLSVDYPDDPVVFEKLGFALLAKTQMLKDEAERMATVHRARVALLRSRELGNDSNLLKAGLEGVEAMLANAGSKGPPPDKDVEAAMTEGEQAYVNGDLDKAAAAYQRGLKLNPQLYEAALFTGDMFFRKKDWDRAGEWFAKAIQINPNRETAYRYWGDSLMMGQNKREESRQKFVEAIVAEPYNRRSWVGLTQWGERYLVELAHPRIEPPADVSALKDNKVTVTIDPKTLGKTDDGSSAWMFYGITRAAWATSKFAKEYPREKYRHSLREEAEALSRVAEVVKEQVKKGEVKKLGAMIETLVKLYDDDMIEPFVLFAKANEGISQDYDAYRNANRDKLRRYLLDYVSSGNEPAPPRSVGML
jgi:tetratricopeptide (TPR) repeat protein